MTHTATLITDSRNASCVAKALSQDNAESCGRVSTQCVQEKVRTTVSSDTIRTLLSTLDDVIRCQMTAEEVL